MQVKNTAKKIFHFEEMNIGEVEKEVIKLHKTEVLEFPFRFEISSRYTCA